MTAIHMTLAGEGTERVPDPAIVLSGAPTSRLWPAVNRAGGALQCGQWVGQPGEMKVRPRAHHEMFTVISGLVELAGDDGVLTVVGPGEAAFIPKGWSGLWRTVELTQKTYVLIASDPEILVA